jgi:hypothetical protein
VRDAGKNELVDWVTAVIVVAPLTGFLLFAWLAK